MGAMASQITSLVIVYSSVYSGANQRKHQSSASLAFVRGIHRWPVNSPRKGSVTQKKFPFDDVIMGLWFSGHWLLTAALIHSLLSVLMRNFCQGQHIESIFQTTFWNVFCGMKNYCILFKISILIEIPLKCVPKCLIDMKSSSCHGLVPNKG